MPLNLIRPQQFTSVIAALQEPGTVYVVPSFQRPYAWIEDQIDDLLRDMEKASRPNGAHYLSALYLIPLKLSRPDDELVEFINGGANQHLQLLLDHARNGHLRTDTHQPIEVLALVDGQQRLTTLFLLAHVYAAVYPTVRSSLYLHLQGNIQIPRLIQNPVEDHDFMLSLIDMIKGAGSPPIPTRQSQTRMLANVNRMQSWGRSQPTALQFLSSAYFKTSAIELEEGYGLISFLTLNDRGKALTVLEKLKSLLLQFASDAGEISLIRRLHIAFGELYRVLDACQHTDLFSDENGDHDIVRLLSCYLRLDKDSKAIWQSAEVAYADFFRAQLLDNEANPPTIILEWCQGVEEVSVQLSSLNQYLDRTLGINDLSLHFQVGNLCDDYETVSLSLGLQPHLLALLLKFRAKFGIEWHERFQVHLPTLSLSPIRALLDDVRQRVELGYAATVDRLYQYPPSGRPARQGKTLDAGSRRTDTDARLESRKATV